MIPSRSVPIRLHLLLFGLLVLFPTLFISGVITSRYASSARATIAEVARDRAADFQRDLDHRLGLALASLSALATSPALEGDDWSKFERQAGDVPGLQGGTLAVFSANGDPLWVSRSATGDEGRSLAPVTGEGAFVSGLQTRVGRPGGRVQLSVPVHATEKPPRVLAWTVDPASFADTLPDPLPDWLAVAVDRDFRVILRSRDNESYVGRSASPEFKRQVVGPAGIVESRTLDGVDVLTAYRRSPLTGWFTLASVPAVTLALPLRGLWWSLGLLIVTGVLASALVAYAYAHYLGRDLGGLSADAEAMASERPVPPVISRVSEVAAVHRALADAAERIAEGREHQRVLLAELNHRVKNTLAIIQTLVGRTLASAPTPEAASATLRGRVGALAAAHDALSDSDWRDASLALVVRRVLSGSEIPVDLAGPDVALRPRTVVAVAQALQEVLSHARERGFRGRAALDWTWDGHALALTWTEAGLPGTPAAPPSGFAATIIQLAIERQLGGKASVESEGGGLVYRWMVPARGELGTNIPDPAA